jgi:hypothetical protein
MMKPTSKTEADLDNIIGIFLGLIITAIVLVIGRYIMDQIITSTPIFSTQLDEMEKTTTAAFTKNPDKYSLNITLKESPRPEIDKPKSRAQLIEGR